MIGEYTPSDTLVLRIGTVSTRELPTFLSSALSRHSRSSLQSTPRLLLDARNIRGTVLPEALLALTDYLAAAEGRVGLRCAVLCPDLRPETRGLRDRHDFHSPVTPFLLSEGILLSSGVALRVFGTQDVHVALEWLSAERVQVPTSALERFSAGMAELAGALRHGGKVFSTVACAIAFGLLVVLAEFMIVSDRPIPFPVLIGNSNTGIHVPKVPVPLDWLLGIPLFFASVGICLGATWRGCSNEARSVWTGFVAVWLPVWESQLPRWLLFVSVVLFSLRFFMPEGHGVFEALWNICLAIALGFVFVALVSMAFTCEVLLPLGLIAWMAFAVGSRIFKRRVITW